MYHAMAQTIFIAGAAKRRVPVYIMKKFDFVKMLENVQKYKITSLIMVPPIVVVCLSRIRAAQIEPQKLIIIFF